MSRRYIHRMPTDRARELERWVHNSADNLDKKLKGAKLFPDRYTKKKADLIIREPFKSGDKDVFNGFVAISIGFDRMKPNFLTKDDKKLWYQKVMEIARSRFGFGIINNLYRFVIDFEEESEDELYALTNHKKEVIGKEGFGRLEDYVKFYTSAVRGYDDLVTTHNDGVQQYLKDLETSSKVRLVA